MYQLHNPCVLQKKDILLFLSWLILEPSTSASDHRRNNAENYLLLQYNQSQTLYFVSCHHPLQSLSALFFYMLLHKIHMLPFETRELFLFLHRERSIAREGNKYVEHQSLHLLTILVRLVFSRLLENLNRQDQSHPTPYHLRNYEAADCLIQLF